MLDGVSKTPLARLAMEYSGMLTELQQSMEDDEKANRWSSFFTRIRDSEECYFRGLWSSLIATNEEIIHDASSEFPRWTLFNLEQFVCESIFNEPVILRTKIEGRKRSSPLDLLNMSTHLNAIFIIYHRGLSDAGIKLIYANIARSVQIKVKILRYVADSTAEGMDRNQVIEGVNVLRARLTRDF